MNSNRTRTGRWKISSRALVIFGAGVVFAGGLAWWAAPWHTARPIMVTGVAFANEPRTAIGLDVDSNLDAMRFGLDKQEESFDVEGALWAGPGGTWRSGAPVECLQPGDYTPVELGFVEVRHGDGPGGPARVVTSLRCLE